jgi:membrane protein YdbS with pleckstrin-like domain
MSLERLYDRKPGEKTAFVLRRHPLTFVRQVLLFALMAGVPALFAWMLWNGDLPPVENPLAKVALVLLGSAYYLGIWVFFLTEFADFYLDVSIVTDRRIIDVDQRGLFNRAISELDLSRVQDVHSEIRGIFPTMFNFGLVVVQTAGEERNFEFENVPDPNRVRERILDLAHQDRMAESKELLGEALDRRGPA